MRTFSGPFIGMSLGRHIWIFAGRWIRTSSARCNGASSGRWKGCLLTLNIGPYGDVLRTLHGDMLRTSYLEVLRTSARIVPYCYIQNHMKRPQDVLLPSGVMLSEHESLDLLLPIRPNLVPEIIFASISV